MKVFKFAVLALLVFVASFAATFVWRDPPVDMSKYENVVPEYQAKIKELMTATSILRNPVYKFRHGAALERLEALAEEGTIAEAIDTAFIYYAKPKAFYCAQLEGCKKDPQSFSRSQTEKAFYWARKMDGKKKVTALTYLLRDARFAPVATEEDRITLMLATEEEGRTALEAALALAFHHLDNRYFGNNMTDEALLWLNRAQELEQAL